MLVALSLAVSTDHHGNVIFVPLNIVSGIRVVQCVNANAVGEVTDERAASEDGLLENHDYVDLRGMTIEDVQEALSFEAEAFLTMEAAGFSEESIEEVDDLWPEACMLPVDFGLGSTVAALSFLRCVPITSCRGKSLGSGHHHAAPTVSFYSDKGVVPVLLDVAKAAGISIENNADMLEVYCADIRKMHTFAGLLSRHTVNPGG